MNQNVLRKSGMTIALFAMLGLGATAQTGNSGSMGSGQSSANSMGTSQASSSKSSSGLSASDKMFVKKAAEGGLAEVQLGQLATEKASSDDVKKFGQRMVDDHSKANDQLKQVASSKGVDLPQDLDARDKATKDHLSKLSGAAFDRAYMKDMVTDHTKDVAEFERESKAGKDPDVKNFAAQTVPTLQDHLKEAKSIAPKTTTTASNRGQ
jgi:putative membrane protein